MIVKAVKETLQGIILDTPVDTGQLRGNWQATLGSPSNKDLTGTLDPTGTSTVAKAELALSKFKLDKHTGKLTTLFLTNNLPYATRIEFGHYSSKAPQGMVRINLAKFRNKLEE